MIDFIAEASGIADKPNAVIMVYVTFPTIEVAKNISKRLIKERLVACANLRDPHESMFMWQGEMVKEKEISVIYKTMSDKVPDIEELIAEYHPYDVPCIMTFDVSGGSRDFLEWVSQQVGAS